MNKIRQNIEHMEKVIKLTEKHFRQNAFYKRLQKTLKTNVSTEIGFQIDGINVNRKAFSKNMVLEETSKKT